MSCTTLSTPSTALESAAAPFALIVVWKDRTPKADLGRLEMGVAGAEAGAVAFEDVLRSAGIVRRGRLRTSAERGKARAIKTITSIMGGGGRDRSGETDGMKKK